MKIIQNLFPIKPLTKTLLVFFLVIVSLNVFSQTREEVFSSIGKVLNKAAGEKVKPLFYEHKIIRQVFTPNEVSSYNKTLGKYGSEMVNRYTEIPWNDLFSHVIFNESSNPKLMKVQIEFKKSLKSEYFSIEDGADKNPSQNTTIELYIRQKDEEEMNKLIVLLYNFKEKKTESAYNAQLKKFSKEETITWLSTKMNKYIQGGRLERDFKISLDECKMVITYDAIVRKYEEVLPTNIKSISKYGALEYESKIASIRSLTKDMFEDGEKTYKAFSSIGIGTQNDEVMENIEFAMKHLAGFCGKGGSSSGSEVTIGLQVWAVKNLDTRYFKNGDRINEANTKEEWQQAAKNGQPAWCYIMDDEQNGPEYGRLYNWFAVNDPRGLAPDGWHIPNTKEVEVLKDFLGGDWKASSKMKTTGFWAKNGGGTNSSGFSAMPGGFRKVSGDFKGLNFEGLFWTTSPADSKGIAVQKGNAIQYVLYNDKVAFQVYQASFGEGCSVRCIQD